MWGGRRCGSISGGCDANEAAARADVDIEVPEKIPAEKSVDVDGGTEIVREELEVVEAVSAERFEALHPVAIATLDTDGRADPGAADRVAGLIAELLEVLRSNSSTNA